MASVVRAGIWRLLSVGVLAILAGCAPAQVSPAPAPATATRGATIPPPTPTYPGGYAPPTTALPLPTITYPPDYVPPPTRPPWPTSTPTPLPTPTPTPYFPPAAAVPAVLPPLPADLFFLRGEMLWRWPAAGGTVEVMARGEERVPLVAYWPASDGRHLVYLSAAGVLTLLDRSSGERTVLPVRGQLGTSFNRMGRTFLQEYALTPDGRYLLYLGWGAAPGDAAGDPNSAAILGVDLEDPARTIELAACLGDMSDWEYPRPCAGFSLSPDGRQLAFSDKSGLWLADVPGGNPRLLVERSWNVMPLRCDVNHPWALRWSPDGRWLLVHVGCYEGDYWTVVDTATGQLVHFPQSTFCYVECRSDAHFGPAGVWMEWEEWDPHDWSGELFLAVVAGEGMLQVSRRITQTAEGPLRPFAVYPFPDGRVGFAQHSCAGAAGPPPAILILEADGRLQTVARLPAVACEVGFDGPPGQTQVAVVWSAEGAAFVYLEKGEPVLLGQSDGAALWDVREALRGATDLQWGPAGGR